VDVELTEEESSALQQALHTYLSNLRSEISGTDDRHFRDGLKEKHTVLEGIEAKLQAAHERTDDRDSQGRTVVRMVSLWWSDQ